MTDPTLVITGPTHDGLASCATERDVAIERAMLLRRQAESMCVHRTAERDAALRRAEDAEFRLAARTDELHASERARDGLRETNTVLDEALHDILRILGWPGEPWDDLPAGRLGIVGTAAELINTNLVTIKRLQEVDLHHDQAMDKVMAQRDERMGELDDVLRQLGWDAEWTSATPSPASIAAELLAARWVERSKIVEMAVELRRCAGEAADEATAAPATNYAMRCRGQAQAYDLGARMLERLLPTLKVHQPDEDERLSPGDKVALPDPELVLGIIRERRPDLLTTACTVGVLWGSQEPSGWRTDGHVGFEGWGSHVHGFATEASDACPGGMPKGPWLRIGAFQSDGRPIGTWVHPNTLTGGMATGYERQLAQHVLDVLERERSVVSFASRSPFTKDEIREALDALGSAATQRGCSLLDAVVR